MTDPSTDNPLDEPVDNQPSSPIAEKPDELVEHQGDAESSRPGASSGHTMTPGASPRPAPPLSAQRRAQVGTRQERNRTPGRSGAEDRDTVEEGGDEMEVATQSASAAGQADRSASAPVPIPSKRGIGQWDDELAEAIGDFSLDELIQGERAEQAAEVPEIDKRYRSTVVRLHRDNVFFSLTGRYEGVASVRQFDSPPEIGTQMDVVVRKYNNEDGLYEVSVPGASIAVSDWSDLEEGIVVEATVSGSNTGGLECTVKAIRGFIPASQVSLYHVEDLSEFVGKKLLCVITEANPNRRNLVLSHRALLQREREENRKQLLEQLEVGQQREGVVSRILDFGAFVDLGGVDGLIHISQLSWDRVNHPSEVLQEGQKVKVRVDKLDRQTGKISLVYRDTADHPWHNIEQRLPVNSVVKGTVSRVAKFGAFVRIAAGVEGLVHISELAHHRVANVANVVQEGQEVDVKILSIDPKEQRISLSIRAAQAKPIELEEEGEQPDEPRREPAVKQHHGPLKGGVDRPSGGGDVGLKW